MALTESRLAPAQVADDAPRGFRPGPRRRARIAIGVALLGAAIGGNVLVYSSLDDRTPVLQVVRDVPAGSQLTADDVRAIDVDADATLRAVPADVLPSIVGQYAKVRLVAGSLVVAESLQAVPLVSPGAAILAIQVPDGALPVGLRERSPVELVVPATDPATAPAVVPGRVVGLPSAPASVTGMLSVSVEVAQRDAAAVVAKDDVRVVLVEPGTDPAYSADGGS